MTSDANTTTRLQRAVKLDHLPPERWQEVKGKTRFGFAIGGVGFLMIAAVVAVHVLRETLSLPLLIPGVVLFGAGMNIASNQMLSGGLMSMVKPIGALRRALFNGKNGDAP